MKKYALVALVFCVGCPPVEEEENPPPIEPACTEPTAVGDCRDQTFVHLSMNLTEVSDAQITNEPQEQGFLSTIDATAGGFGGNEAWVYARFTENGLEKVDLLDDASFDSMEWDVAFRRFVIRLNSGDAGPSCVSAARTPPGTVFADFNELIDGLTFNQEDFITPPSECELIADGSGLPSSPGVVLQSYWDYASCLQMTHNVFVVERADGHHVKLEVLSYYAPDAQQECDETGSNDGAGSANIRMQWAFID